MALCITENSVKLYSEYFKRKFETELLEGIEYPQLIQALYKDVLKNVNGKTKADIETSVSNEDIAFQHMFVVPFVLADYLNKNDVENAYSALSTRALQERGNVFNAFKQGFEETVAKAVISRYGDLITGKESALPIGSGFVITPPPVVSSMIWFNTNLNTIVSKNFTIKSPSKNKTKDQYTNIDNPAYVYQINAARKILDNDNLEGYQLRLVLQGSLKDVPGWSKTPTGEKIYSTKNNTPLLVIVDRQGNYVRFDKAGNVDSENGIIPAFEIYKTPSALGKKSGERKLYDRTSPDAQGAWAKVDNYTAIIMKEKGLKEAQAMELAVNMVLDEIEAHVAKMKGHIEFLESSDDPIIFDIDLVLSSAGRAERINSNYTDVSEIKNLDELSIGVKPEGGSRMPRLIIPGSTSGIPLQNKALETLPESEKQVLIRLLTDNTLTDQYGNKLTKDQRSAFIEAYMQLGGNRSKIQVDWSPSKTNEIRKITLGGIGEFTISGSEVSEKTRLKNAERFANAFLEYISKPVAIKYKGVVGQNVTVWNSIDDAIGQQQLFVDEVEGVMMAIKPEISFGLTKDYDDIKASKFDKPVAITDEGAVVTQSVSYYDHIVKHSTTDITLDFEGNIKLRSPYFVYIDAKQATAQAKPSRSRGMTYMTKAEANMQEAKVVSYQERAVDNWFKNSGWADIGLNVIFKDKVHEYGPEYLASFFRDTITLWKGSNQTAIYHEVMHVWIDAILTPEEKAEMLNAIRTDFGDAEFTTIVNGRTKTIKFSEATDLEIEEWLAEEFRKYATNRSLTDNLAKSKNLVQRFFDKLIEIFSKIFGVNAVVLETSTIARDSARVQKIFNDLYTGNVNFANFSPVRSKQEKFQSFELSPTIGLEFTNQEVYTAMESMSVMMADFAQKAVSVRTNKENNSKVRDLWLQRSRLTPKREGDLAKIEKIDEELDSLMLFDVSARASGFFLLEESPALLQLGLEYIYNQLKEYSELPEYFNADQIESLKKVVKHFGDPKADLKTYKLEKGQLPINLIQLYLSDYSSLSLDKASGITLSTIEEGLEDTRQNNFEWLFDRSGNEFDVAETVDEKTKELLSTLPQRDSEGNLVLNEFGVPAPVPFRLVLNKVLRVTDGTLDRDVMERKLRALANNGDFTIEVLLQRLGALENANELTEQVQWLKFWHSVGKATIRLRTLTFEKIDSENESEPSTILAKSGRNKLTQVKIIDSWSMNFRSKSLNKTADTFWKNSENGSDRVLDVKKLFEFFDRKVYAVEINNASIQEQLALYSEKKEGYYRREVPLWLADPAQFLTALGIEIESNLQTAHDLKHGTTLPNGDRIDSQFISLLVKRLKASLETTSLEFKSLNSVFDKFTLYSEVNGIKTQQPYESMKGYLDRLANYATEYNEQYITFSSYTPGGEKQNEKSYHSTMTVLATFINEAKHINELSAIPGFTHLDYTVNPILAANKTFRQMFQLDSPIEKKRGERLLNNNGKPLLSFDIENVVGIKVQYKNDETGVKSIKTDINTKFGMEFHHTLIGRQEVMRTEAKSSSFTVNQPHIRDGVREFNLHITNQEMVAINSEAYDTLETDAGLILYREFAPYIEAELVRMQKIERIKERIQNGEQIQFDAEFLNNGSDFIIFDIILEDSTQGKLKELNSESGFESFTINDRLDAKFKKKIDTEILKYFRERSGQLSKAFKSELKIADDTFNQFKLEEENQAETIERMFDLVAVNSYINYLGFQAVFLGDPASYDIAGENFHKRIAGATSTGVIAISDNSWYNFIEHSNVKPYGFAEKYFAELSDERKTELTDLNRPTTYQKREYQGYLNTGVMKEAVSVSAYLPQYKMLGINNEQEYSKMQEADGSAYISFDAYRLLSMSMNEWSPQQEDLYQAMLRGDDVDLFEIRGSFPIKKYQYKGALFNEDQSIGLTAMAFHKYSVVPLIPVVIESTPLEDLHNRMMEQGSDYVGMKSISKLSTISNLTYEKGEFKAIDNIIYDVENGRVITEEKIVNNKIHIKFLKSQVHIAEGFKGKITLFSQMRKLVYLGIFENGAPVDFRPRLKDPQKRKAAWELIEQQYNEGKITLAEVMEKTANGEWSLRYEDAINDLQTELKNILLEDLGLVEVGKGKYEGETDKLLSYLQRQLKAKDLLPEEISDLIDPITGRMQADLSLSLHAATIESILTSLVDKTLRAVKVTGEGFIQQSGAMMERKPQFKLADEGVSTNGLRTYSGLDADGNLVTNESDDITKVQFMDVKIALQGGFKDLLYLNWNGEQIAVYKEIEDSAGKKVRKLDGKASLARLNQAIADEAWFEEHKQFLTLTGPRIPTQALASLEAAYVREFLHPSADKAIVLPAEIVAKAGSDFDIDKLYLMYPNIVRYGNSVELVQRVKSNKSKAQLKLDIQNAENAVKRKQDDLRAAKKEKENVYLSLKQAKNLDTGEIEELKRQRDLEWEMWQTFKDRADELWSNKESLGLLDSQVAEIHVKETTPGMDRHKAEALAIQEQIDALIAEEFANLLSVSIDEDKTLQESYDAQMVNAENQVQVTQRDLDQATENYYNARRAYMNAGTKGIENKLIELFGERIGKPESLKQLVEPNATDFFTEKTVIDADGNETKVENLAEILKKKLERASAYKKVNNGARDGKYGKRGIPGSTAWDLHFNIRKHQENSVGIDALGVAAVVSTYYAMFTKMGAYLKGVSKEEQAAYIEALKIWKERTEGQPLTAEENARMEKLLKQYSGRTIKFNHNKVNWKDKTSGADMSSISVSFINNVDGLNISDVIGQLINGFVDVAKKPWIFDIQGTMENTPQLLFMLMAGVSIDTAVNFSSIPLVVEYNNLKAKMQGALYNLNNEHGESPIKSKSSIQKDAREEMFKRYADAIYAATGKPIRHWEFNFLAALEDNFTNEDFIAMQDNPGSFKELVAFAHYLQIERMSDDLTRFTMNTKYDTQRIKNISDTDARQTAISNHMSSEYTSIPSEWYDSYNKTITGLLNNDQFIQDLFAKHFKIRNNKAMIKASAGVQRAEDEQGKDISTLRKRFKDVFIHFLYQNSLFNDDVYNGISVKQDNTISEFLEVEYDQFNEIVGYKYNTAYKLDVLNEIELKTGLSGLIRLFPTEMHLTRFMIEYKLVNQELEDLTPKELEDNYYHFAYSAKKRGFRNTKPFTLVALALYRSKNNVAMFDNLFGYANMLMHILNKRPELKRKYKLLQDLNYSNDKTSNSLNMYLAETSDPQIMRIYRENLQALKSSPYLEVMTFFQNFEDMALMQTGMQRGSIYDLARLVTDPKKYAMVINSQLNLNKQLIKELDAAEKLIEQDVPINTVIEKLPVLNRFTEEYHRLNVPNEETGAKQINRINKGLNLIVENLNISGYTGVQKTPLANTNIIEFTGTMIDAPGPMAENGVYKITSGSDLYRNGEIDYEYLEQLSKAPRVGIIAGQKLYALESTDLAKQRELDEALFRYLNIDNTGQYPIVMPKAALETENNVSIFNANVSDAYTQRKNNDEYIGSESTKIIAKPAESTVIQANFTQAYVDKINENKSAKVAGNKQTRFKPEDKVWIFGPEISRVARNKNIALYRAEIEKLFNDFYVKYIDRAIDSGVKSFHVGTEYGIESLAYDYLLSKGYIPVPKYTPAGKYFEFVAEVTEQDMEYLDSTADVTYVGYVQEALEENKLNIVDLIYDKNLEERVNNMPLAEVVKGDAKRLVELSITKILKSLSVPNSALYDPIQRQKLIEKLVRSGRGPIEFKDVSLKNNKITFVNQGGLYKALVEQVLYEFRDTYKNAYRTGMLADKLKMVLNVPTVSGHVKLLPSALRPNGSQREYYNTPHVQERILRFIGEINSSSKTGIKALWADILYRSPDGKISGKQHFGNPFISDELEPKTPIDKTRIVKRFSTQAEAVSAYREWLTTDTYDAQFPQLKERKDWILDKIISGVYKNATIYYKKELNQMSHANVLDMLIHGELPISQADVDNNETCG